jgi:hypothetical protein
VWEEFAERQFRGQHLGLSFRAPWFDSLREECAGRQGRRLRALAAIERILRLFAEVRPPCIALAHRSIRAKLLKLQQALTSGVLASN